MFPGTMLESKSFVSLLPSCLNICFIISAFSVQVVKKTEGDIQIQTRSIIQALPCMPKINCLLDLMPF